jgi:hypothetical protein
MPGAAEKVKRFVTSITLIFSCKHAKSIYHLPWLNDFLPMLEELVLRPLGIPSNQIIRMQFANMARESDIDYHRDNNSWVGASHRVHVPIITHSDIFFLARTLFPKDDVRELLRIKSNVGEVYEFNNALVHAVHNLGSSRVHLIIDWVHSPIDENALVRVNPGEVCVMRRNFSDPECGLPDETGNLREEL